MPDLFLPATGPEPPEASWQRAFDELHTRVENLLDHCDGLDRIAAAGVATITTTEVRRILQVAT